MNAEQLIDGIGKAVAANNNLDEYCFLFINFDPICTNISMWGLIISAFGTIGTVAAVLVALWISYKSDRQKAKYDSIIKSINIVNLLPIFNRLIKDIEGVTNYGVFVSPENDNFIKAREAIDDFKEWAKHYEDSDVLAALIPNAINLLPRKAGLQISYAVGIIRAAQIEILRYIPEAHPAIDFCSRSKVSEWTSEMQNAKIYLNAAIRFLEREVDLKSLKPTVDELFEEFEQA